MASGGSDCTISERSPPTSATAGEECTRQVTEPGPYRPSSRRSMTGQGYVRRATICRMGIVVGAATLWALFGVWLLLPKVDAPPALVRTVAVLAWIQLIAL